jgi:transposase InsO family protein
VIHFLHRVTGPSVGLPALRCLFPGIRRCVLEDLLLRYRRVWRRRYLQRGFRLTWHHAGAVWAMDHSEPLQPVDGVSPYLLAVRDLASHRQLAWHPVQTVTAEETLPILVALFRQHGAPLVLKSDNGSAFIAAPLRHTMQTEEVAQLFSPVRRPSYNGALERSNGVLKTYTHRHALHEGHPLRWTSDDLDHAMQLANTISRPWGHRGPTPEEVWQARQPISDRQRHEFQTALQRHRALAVDDLGIDSTQPTTDVQAARLDRVALRRAMEQLGYLTLERVRRPPKKPKRRSRPEMARRAQSYVESNADKPCATTINTQWLAPSAAGDRMHDSNAGCDNSIDPHPASHASTSVHRERAIPFRSRRFITPLIRLAKAAKIMR